MRVDKMSMGVSLEGRVPFLDHKFVELAMSIPTSVKTKHGTLKYILKKSVRGLIPDEVIDRKKQGFGVPIYEWLSGALGSFARSKLDKFNGQTDFFDAAELGRVMSLSGASGGNSFQAWCLLNFVIWWEQYIAGAAPESPAMVDFVGSGDGLQRNAIIQD
jgi:asparagine synthase (glutamine-hydrolysing)